MAKAHRDFRRKARGRYISRLMARDGEMCAICGRKLDRHLRDFDHSDYITFDHIVPRSSGGSDRFENIRLTHKVCNNDRDQGLIPIWPWEEEHDDTSP